MVSSTDCIQRWGEPIKNNVKWELATGLAMWNAHMFLNTNQILRLGPIPSKIYMNKIMMFAWTNAVVSLLNTGLINEIHEYNGCYNIRKIKGSTDWSTHSWAIGVDLNAATNPLGAKPKLNPKVVEVFKACGFDWGGDFKGRKDGMHFQLNEVEFNKHQ